MRKRDSFNEAAQLYDAVRPTYPDELIDWIIEKTKLNKNDDLLEIAPGTGQCTKKFAERDFKIHSVELGNKLAELLLFNMKGKNVTVEVAPFEEWESKHIKKYKLIYCATAWHWLDPSIKYHKSSELLHDDGRLAVIWNNSVGDMKNDVLKEAYRLLFTYHDETPHSIKPKTKDEIKKISESTKEMLEESKHFLLDDYYEQIWSSSQSRKKTIQGFYSQSSFLSLCKEDQKELKEKLSVLFENLDDELEVHFKSVVYLCKKRIK